MNIEEFLEINCIFVKTLIMEQFKNIKEFLSEFSELKELEIDEKVDFGNENIEYYVVYEYHRYRGVFQLNDNESNKNSQIKSKWSDDYLRDGGDDEEFIRNNFDEYLEVFEDDFFTIFVNKIISKNFNKILNDKLDEFKKSDSYDSFSLFYDFCDWLDDYGMCSSKEDFDSFTDIISEDEISVKNIVDEVNIDNKYNIIKWGSWSLTQEENLKLMYRVLKD